ncbi:Protein ALP1-like [Anabarilius grahami]|uniref:Putative nuclease HARBI1 n=1 Tax=Anabarilius grahami TaxID=495550 RepID=A0A3N0YMC2_ANAGA|nr:Protein ALP1-like [Anabarilius grahami]
MEVLCVVNRERERPLRDRADPLTLPDHALLRLYRLPRNSVMYLTYILRDNLQRKTKRSSPLPVIMVVLRFFASGSFRAVLSNTVGTSQSSVCRTVSSVSRALSRMVENFIKFPSTAAEQILVKQKFFEIAAFPNVLGAVDGTHVAIKAPSDDEELYVNRKNFHSVNALIVCDASLKITNLGLMTHDPFILTTSALCQQFSEGQIPDGWLLGDSGYPLRPWLMTPILHPASEAHDRSNRAQRKTRGVVERCTGVLKSRFRCTDHSGGVLLYTPERACQITAAVCVVHNICQMHRVPLLNIPEAPDEPDEPLRDVANPSNSGLQARNNLKARRFT